MHTPQHTTMATNVGLPTVHCVVEGSTYHGH